MSFTYGYGCCVFKHNIYGDQPEVLDCMPDSLDFLSLECFASLGCPPVPASFEGVVVGVHRREVAEEEPGRGAPSWGFKWNIHFFFFFFFFP